jgi:replication factor C large subunit
MIERLNEWLRGWAGRSTGRKAVLLVGPSGIGKTSVVGALANDLDAELVEFNASDKRSKAVIESQVWQAATQETIDGRMRIVLLDEVDGLSGTSDRGGFGAIVDVIEQTAHPIVLTANDAEDNRVKDLRRSCDVLEFRPASTEEVLTVLSTIAGKAGAQIDRDTMMMLAEAAGGDLRAAISDLEMIVSTGMTVGSDWISQRDVQRKMQESIGRLFMSMDAGAARKVVSDLDVDQDEFLLWVEENAGLHLLTPSELERGFESLSLSDLALGRIMRRQEWKMLAYAYDFMSAGVATSRTVTPYCAVQYSEPAWPLMVWKGNRMREKYTPLVSRLSAAAGVSEFRLNVTYLHTIESLIRRKPGSRQLIADWLGVKASSLALREDRRQHPL